jgi:hypothetical protein
MSIQPFIKTLGLTPKQEGFILFLWQMQAFDFKKTEEGEVLIPLKATYFKSKGLQIERDIRPLIKRTLVKRTSYYQINMCPYCYGVGDGLGLLYAEWLKNNRPVKTTQLEREPENFLEIIPDKIQKALSLLPQTLPYSWEGFYQSQLHLLKDATEEDSVIFSKVMRLGAIAGSNGLDNIHYGASKTGRIYTLAQKIPSGCRPFIFPGLNDLDVVMSHTQFMCHFLRVPFNLEWAGLRGDGSGKEEYNRSFGRYDPQAPHKQWPWVKPLKDGFAARVDAGNLADHNACRIPTPDLSALPKTEQYQKYHAFFMQGLEAAFIHGLTTQGYVYNFKPLLNMHDGLITDKRVLHAAVLAAARAMGINNVEVKQAIL